MFYVKNLADGNGEVFFGGMTKLKLKYVYNIGRDYFKEARCYE